MSRILASDKPGRVHTALSILPGDSLHAILQALLDTLLPASEDGRMPSAADTDFAAHLERNDPGYGDELEGVLRGFGPSFANLDLTARVAVVTRFSLDHPAAFGALIQRVYDCYYRDPRVRAAIGVNAGAPFPQGNTVAPGDLSLLDPVIHNSDRHRYRSPRR